MPEVPGKAERLSEFAKQTGRIAHSPRIEVSYNSTAFLQFAKLRLHEPVTLRSEHHPGSYLLRKAERLIYVLITM